MSAATNPSPAPVQAPPQVVPPGVPLEPQRRFSWKSLVVLGLVAGCVWIGYQLWPKPRGETRPAAVALVRTAKVAIGTVERVVRATGQTAARNYSSITVPIMRGPDSRRDMVLIKLASAGSMVKKGELVAQIDAQSLQDHIDDMDDTVAQAQGDVRKRQAEQSIERENLLQSIRAAKADWDKAKLEAAAAEIRTQIDQELLKLDAEEAEAQYKALQDDLKSLDASQKAELRILEITAQRHREHRDRHANDLKKFTTYAPMTGMVVMPQLWRSGQMGQVQEGDQVSPGQLFMKIVDPTAMQVEATVSQAESTDLRIGQRADVGLDAFPGLILKGRVHTIGALAVGTWRQQSFYRTVPVRIAIEGSDPRLIPDLSAWANIKLNRQEKAAMVPLEAIFTNRGKPVIYVKQGARFEQRPVELGLRSTTHAAVLSGVKPGEEVALERPKV